MVVKSLCNRYEYTCVEDHSIMNRGSLYNIHEGKVCEIIERNSNSLLVRFRSINGNLDKKEAVMRYNISNFSHFFKKVVK